MAAGDDALRLLESIDASLKALVSLVQRREAKTRQAAVASDRDLDGKYGDPKVTFNPRDWTGPSFKGLRLSECPAEFLELLSETLDYFAEKAEQTNETYNDKPVAPYKRKDAARARGWAKRMRDGKRAPAAVAEPAADWSQDANPWADETDRSFS